MRDKTKIPPNHFLWRARKRSHLGQKNVAFLIGHKAHNKISLYESGQRIPTLQTALELEIIYKVPVRLLFYQLFSRAMWRVRERGLKYKNLSTNEILDLSYVEKQLQDGDYCTYAELLKVPNLPEVEREKIRDHLRYLAKTANKVNGIDS